MNIQLIAPGMMTDIEISSGTTVRDLKLKYDLHEEMQASCNGIKLYDGDVIPDDAKRVVLAAGSKGNTGS